MVTTYTRNAGEFVELLTTSPVFVSANKPIQGMQLSQSMDKEFVPAPNGGGGPIGDPMMVSMPTTNTNNWQTNVNLVGSEGFAGYVTLVSRDFFMTSMTLNGNAINGWQYIGSSRFKFVRVALNPGNNVINGVYIGGAIGNVLPAKFVAIGYGFGLYDAIGSVSGGLAVANNYVNVRPADPTALSATAFSSTEIDLAWTDNSNNEYGFRIERKTETGDWGFVADRPANSVAFRDSGLTKKTKYYYRVFAYTDEDSNPSNMANATTLNEKPAVPVGLSAIAQNDSEIRLTWVDASDNEDSFIVERKQNSVGTWGEVKTTLSNVVLWTDTGLTKKTAYSYRVKAHNEMGDSVWSNISGDTTKDTKPNKPLNLVATANSYSQITLTWTDDSNNEDTFRIERKTATTSWIPIGSRMEDQTSFFDYNLTGDTTYTYRVFAVNNGGDSLPSNEASATTLLPPPPSAPTNLTAKAVSSSQINLKWTDNSSLETSFIVQRRAEGQSGWNTINTLPANSTSYPDTTCQAYTTYEYQVRAQNGGGPSAYSNIASAKTYAPQPPGATPYLMAIDIQDGIVTSGSPVTAWVIFSKPVTQPTVVSLAGENLNLSTQSIVVGSGQSTASFTLTSSLTNTFGIGKLNAKAGKFAQAFTVVACGAYSDLESPSSSLGVCSAGQFVKWTAFAKYYLSKDYGTVTISRNLGLGWQQLASLSLAASGFLDSTPISGYVQYRIDVRNAAGNVVHSNVVMHGNSFAGPSGVSVGTISNNSEEGQIEFTVNTGGIPEHFDVYLDGIAQGSVNCKESGTAVASYCHTGVTEPGSHQIFLIDEYTGRSSSNNNFILSSDTTSVVCELYFDANSSLGDNIAFGFDPNRTSSSISIRNSSGDLVRSYEMYGPVSSVTWDGRNEVGNLLPPGEYDVEAVTNVQQTQKHRRVKISRQAGDVHLLSLMTQFSGCEAKDKEEHQAVISTFDERQAQTGVGFICWLQREGKSVEIDTRKRIVKMLRTTIQGFHLTSHGIGSTTIGATEPITDLITKKYASFRWGGLYFFPTSGYGESYEGMKFWKTPTPGIDELDSRSSCDIMYVGRSMAARNPMQFLFLDCCNSAGEAWDSLGTAVQPNHISQNDVWKISFRFGPWGGQYDQSYLCWRGTIGQNDENGTDRYTNLKMRKQIWEQLKTKPFYQAFSAVTWATLNFAGHDVRTGFPGMSGGQRADVSGGIVGLP